jgi:hypothetical protein
MVSDLEDKVDKDGTKALSDENYTLAEKKQISCWIRWQSLKYTFSRFKHGNIPQES